MEFNYPHIIENGGSEQLTFVRLVKNGDTDYLTVEGIVEPGAGPPMHVHHKQDETITVVKGKLATQVLGQQAQYHAEGETVSFKAGVPHKFWNPGAETTVTSGYIQPANNVVYYLSAIYQSIKENGGKRPGTFDAAYLAHRYKSEFDTLDIPPFVKKVIFPVALFGGKLLGMHKKFSDAPEAV